MNMPPYTGYLTYEKFEAWELWLLLRDAFNAMEFGYEQTRFPMPGQKINVEEAKAKIRNIEFEWNKEWTRRDRVPKFYTGPPHFTQMPLNTQLWLASEVKRLSAKIEPYSVVLGYE